MPADPVRDAAVDVLLRVFEHGAYINIALDKKLKRRQISSRGRRFLTQLVYGTVRHTLLCDYILEKRVRQPLAELPRPIHIILRMGVFQALFCDNVTFPAMVHTSVDLAKKRGHAGTARLTNAVLHRVPQSLDTVELPDPNQDGQLAVYLSVRYSLPLWLVQRWLDTFGPTETEALCAACNEEAPVSLRVNRLRTDVESAQKALERAGCIVQKATPIPEELTLHSGLPPARMKAFGQGDFFVQDPGSMLAAHLLAPEPGQRVLDLCAAPGGKSTHLAELMGEKGHIAALDIHRGKLRLIRENTARLGLSSVQPICGDGTAPPFGHGFQRVLVDAPCSGLGTLRRHPELTWRLAETDFAEFGALQRRLLQQAIGLCENQGVVVYSVCTFTPEETESVIEPLRHNESVQLEDGPDWLNPWKIETGIYRTLPNLHGLDGFFLTRFRKQS